MADLREPDQGRAKEQAAATASTPVAVTPSPDGEAVTPASDAPALPRASAVLQPGAMVDHYKVVRLLGRGGMGEVYLARDTKLGRKVALKVIHPSHFGSEEAAERFLLEARATARFSHPNIVTIYGSASTEGHPYVALEYLEGQTLRQRMEERRLGVREALRFGLSIAEALAEAHGNKVLHRDLKPENVLIPRDGRLRVVDFGLAKPIRAASGAVTADELQSLDTPRRIRELGPGPCSSGRPVSPQEERGPRHAGLHGPRAVDGSRRPPRPPTSGPWAWCSTSWSPARSPTRSAIGAAAGAQGLRPRAGARARRSTGGPGRACGELISALPGQGPRRAAPRPPRWCRGPGPAALRRPRPRRRSGRGQRPSAACCPSPSGTPTSSSAATTEITAFVERLRERARAARWWVPRAPARAPSSRPG